MDILISIVLIVVTYLILAIVKWAVRRYNRLKLFERYGIPGPKPSFLTGNLTELKSEPTPNGIITKWLKKYGDVFGFYIGEIPYVIIKDLDMIKQVIFCNYIMQCSKAKIFIASLFKYNIPTF